MIKSKYTFKLLTKNGLIVDQVVIIATDLDDAKRKLGIKYHLCEILDYQVEESVVKAASFDEILDLISNTDR